MIVQLTGTSSLADLQQRLRGFAAAHPSDKWIIGFGWNQELWPNKSFPTAADLDAVVRDRPVVLERIDGHAIVVNSAADESRRERTSRHSRSTSPRIPAAASLKRNASASLTIA